MSFAGLAATPSNAATLDSYAVKATIHTDATLCFYSAENCAPEEILTPVFGGLESGRSYIGTMNVVGTWDQDSGYSQFSLEFVFGDVEFSTGSLYGNPDFWTSGQSWGGFTLMGGTDSGRLDYEDDYEIYRFRVASLTYQPAPIPLPAGAGLLLSGLALGAILRRRG